jgi:integrase
MASINKRKNADGSTSYRVRWRDGYQRQQSHTCPDLSTAKRVKIEVERARALGEDWQPPRSEDGPGVPTLTEVAQAYLDARARRLAPETVRCLTSILRTYLTHLASGTRGALYPELVTTESLLTLHDDLLASGCGQAGTTSRVGKILRFWRWAEEHPEWGSWFARPPSSLDLSPGVVEKRNAGARPPTWEEADAFIHEIKPLWLQRIATIQRYTGLRVGQAKRLRWMDLDLERGLLTVRPELGKSTQERRGRVVPVSQHLIDEVSGWGVREGWLCGKDPATRYNTADFTLAWRSAGVPRVVYHRQPTHALRHLVINGLRSSGVVLDIVQFLVGHARTVTSAVYTHDETLIAQARDAVALIPKIDAECDRCVPIVAGGVGTVE